MTVEIGAVVKTGIAGFAQSEFVLAGFRKTLFGSQFEVVGGVGGGGGGGGIGRHKSNRSSSSSPVVRSSSSHRMSLCRATIIPT